MARGCAACATRWAPAWPACERCGCPASVPIVDENAPARPARAPRPARLADVSPQRVRLVATGDTDVDTALGGGLATCGSYLLTGSPGAGKTTLALRTLARNGGTLVSCEMPAPMVRALCDKGGFSAEKIAVFVPETLDEAIEALAAARGFAVLDSLGRLPDRPNPVAALGLILDATQRARAAGKLCVIVLSQQTKSGSARGSLELEHDVDGVLELEKTEVRVTKHRLGASETQARTWGTTKVGASK